MKKFILAGILFGFGIMLVFSIASGTSCSEVDEPEVPAYGIVTFKYTIPDKLFKYLEIEACWNNDEGTNMIHRAMLDSVFVVRYRVSKLPDMKPVVFIFKRTNRPIPNKLIECYLDMEVKTDIRVGDKIIDEVYRNRYYIDDVNAADAIETLMKDQRNSTYALKVNALGETEYIAPKQRPILIELLD